jgi:hypothetical protein
VNEVLLWIGVSMGAVIIALLVVLLFRLAAIREEGIVHYQEAFSVLEVTRDMAISARDNRRETAIAVEGVKGTIEEMPEKTAKKVAEKMPESRADWRGHGA